MFKSDPTHYKTTTKVVNKYIKVTEQSTIKTVKFNHTTVLKS